MIDRQSLVWKLGSRLTLLLVLMTALGVAGLVWHTHEVEAGLGNSSLVHEVIREFFSDLAWGIPIVIAIVITGGGWTIKQALKPLRATSDAARAIEPGCLDGRLPVAGLPSEITPLVQAANGALDRMQEAYAAQQRFIATAAHELRTPIAIVRAAAERLPPGPDRSAMLADVDRLGHLAGQLLTLARVERNAAITASADAVPLLRQTALELAPAAAAQGIFLGVEAPDSMMVKGDAEKLTAIMRNLIENALNHEPEGGEVIAALSADGQLTVIDHGPGIPAEHRSRIFARFERGEWTKTGGTGLGLAIVQDAAQSIGAVASVSQADPGHTQFDVRFLAA
jgi:signal transduction histidine kinase